MTVDPRRPGEFHGRDMHRAVDTVAGVWPWALDDLRAIGFPRSRTYDGAPSGGHGSILVSAEDGTGVDRVPATGVEIVALNTHAAVAWIAELHDVTVRVLCAAYPGVHTHMPALGSYGTVMHPAVDRILEEWTVDDLIDADPRSGNHRRDVFGLYRLADMGVKCWPPPAKTGERVGVVTVGARSNLVEVCVGCGLPIGGGRADPCRRIDGDPFHLKNTAGTWCYHAALRSRGRLGGRTAS